MVLITRHYTQLMLIAKSLRSYISEMKNNSKKASSISICNTCDFWLQMQKSDYVTCFLKQWDVHERMTCRDGNFAGP